jgi:hypothetical protein
MVVLLIMASGRLLGVNLPLLIFQIIKDFDELTLYKLIILEPIEGNYFKVAVKILLKHLDRFELIALFV